MLNPKDVRAQSFPGRVRLAVVAQALVPSDDWDLACVVIPGRLARLQEKTDPLPKEEIPCPEVKQAIEFFHF